MTVCAAIVLAAGQSERFGGNKPKQYEFLGNSRLIRWSLNSFSSHPSIKFVLPVINMSDLERYNAAAAGLNILSPIQGGRNRQHSVRIGLEAVFPLAPDVVLIHDAARPFVTHDLIDRLLGGLQATIAGVIPVTRSIDTVKSINARQEVIQTIPRENLVNAQTPQVYQYDKILLVHQEYKAESMTDDSALIEKSCYKVATVEGDTNNFKITDISDLERAKKSIMETRTGLGFDIHRFGSGNKLVLGGISIPSSKSLVSHSDGDVVLHAITDSLLGAIGDADIGTHFPDSDPSNYQKDSQVFLNYALDVLKIKKAKINNIDITIICEVPKIKPFRPAMRRYLSDALDVSEERVSIKAKTFEGIGSIGRGEGIACQVITTISVFSCYY